MTQIDRRRLLTTAATAAGALTLSRCVTSRASEDELEAPTFTEGRVLRTVAGFRPFRTTGPRIELVNDGPKPVIHNYGYGGCGFTMSWGTADVVAELLRGVSPEPSSVAVLGAGAVGLASAQVLVEQGHKVTIYARDLSPNTVSDIAGAQWGPAIIAKAETPAQQALYARILTRAHARFKSLLGSRYGVYERENFFPEGVDADLDRVPDGVLPPPVTLSRLPLPGTVHRGRSFRTLLIEPPRYLPALTVDLLRQGVEIKVRAFASREELAALPERYLVNCLGMGAGELFSDPDLQPVRGQLVHLQPQPLPYMLVHAHGYIFPRSDAVVLGGTVERGVADATPTPDALGKIMARNREFFYPASGEAPAREADRYGKSNA
jgi:glycine/D-amino acid oxidase-like deaminating enzyme